MTLLTPQLSMPTVFTKRFSLITGRRWDPLFHERDLYAFVRGGRANLVPLGKMVARMITGFGAGKSDQSDASNGCVQIRPTNISDARELIFERNVYIANQVLDERPQDVLTRDEVLFNNTNSQLLVGKTVLFDLPGRFCASNHITRIKVDSKLMRPAFLAYLLNHYQERGVFFRICTNWNNQSGVGPEVLRQILVPELDGPAQDRILKVWLKVVEEKRATEAQARQLLASIDGLLLAELGITLPTEPPATLPSRVFTRPFSELTGRRFDPASHSRTLNLTGGKFPSEPLTKIARLNPRTDFAHLESAPVSFVPMEAVSDDLGEADCTATRPADAAKNYTPFQEGDVISAKITPCMENGKAAVLRGLVGGFGYGSTEFHVFRPDASRLHADYLHALLRLHTLRVHARLFFTGSAGHQRVSEEFFHRLQIPVPPLSTQRRIVKKISAVRAEAKALRAAAVARLAAAKQEIEAMILGQ